jgi:hypothetical protein
VASAAAPDAAFARIVLVGFGLAIGLALTVATVLIFYYPYSKNFHASGSHKAEELKLQPQEEHVDADGQWFWFITREAFLQLPDDECLPRHQTLRAQGKLVRKFITMEDVVSGRVAKDTGAISHRWLKPFHVDPDRLKLQKIKGILLDNPTILFIWMDWVSLPQKHRDDGTIDRRSPREQMEFEVGLQNVLPYIYLGCQVILLWDADYNRRFWPCVEAWTSMRTVTHRGCVPSSSRDIRAKVYGIGGSEGNDDAATCYMFGTWLHKTAKEAVSALENDEYFVTNTKDKATCLQIVEGLDEKVRTLLKEGLKSAERVAGRPCTRRPPIMQREAGSDTMREQTSSDLEIVAPSDGIGDSFRRSASFFSNFLTYVKSSRSQLFQSPMDTE